MGYQEENLGLLATTPTEGEPQPYAMPVKPAARGKLSGGEGARGGLTGEEGLPGRAWEERAYLELLECSKEREAA